MDSGPSTVGGAAGFDHSAAPTDRPARSAAVRVDRASDRVVVGVDGSLGVLTAVSWAAAEAAHRGADLHLVQARPAGDERTEDARSSLHRALGTAAAVAPDVAVTVVGETGCAGSVLVDHAVGATLLVVGGRRLTDTGPSGDGTVAHLLGRAPCPLIVVPPRQTGAWASTPSARPVLVGVDGGPGDGRAMDLALDTAHRRRVPLCAVGAGHPAAGAGEMATLRERARAHGAQWIEVTGELAGALRVAGQRAQLIVLSARASSAGADRDHGPSSMGELLSRSPCAVMVTSPGGSRPASPRAGRARSDVPAGSSSPPSTASSSSRLPLPYLADGGAPHDRQRPRLVEPAHV